MKKKIIPAVIAIALILVVIAAAAGIKLIGKYTYTKERADLNEYFNITEDNQIPVLLQEEMIEEWARQFDGVYYFDLATVHKYFNTRFYEDKGENLLLYTTPDEIIRTEIGTAVYQDSREEHTEEYALSRYEGEQLYLAADYVKKFTNFSYDVYEAPNRIQVYTAWEERKTAELNKDTALRYQGGVKSPILTDLKQGDSVIVLEEMEKWSRVQTRDAFIGYVENKRLDNTGTETPIPVTDYEEPVYTNISKPYKISLGWHAVASMDGNGTLETVLKGTISPGSVESGWGINTISPTWFALNDSEGNFASLADHEYVSKAHDMGLEVWGLVDNFTYKDAVDTYAVLSSTSKRQKLIDGLIQAALEYELDGINVDFEQISIDAGEHFVEFIRELSIPCRANGIVLSVDNYVPTGGTNHYDRKEQGVVADYVIIMGYDEHYRGSDEAGSVASIGFVERGIKDTVEQAPPEKVINAIPFYTRIWETSGAELDSQAVGMQLAEDFVAQNQIEILWDDETCQNYGEAQVGDTFYQVWLEDEQSIETKLGIMANYNLAGVAAWKLGFEKPEIWQVIGAYLNG